VCQKDRRAPREEGGAEAPSFQTGYKEEIFYDEGGETLEWVAQRGGRCPIPGSIQGQVGRCSEKPDLVEDLAAYGSGVGIDDV